MNRIIALAFLLLSVLPAQAVAPCDTAVNIQDWYYKIDATNPGTQRWASARGVMVTIGSDPTGYDAWILVVGNCDGEFATLALMYAVVNQAAVELRPYSYNAISASVDFTLTNPVNGAILSGNDLGVYSEINTTGASGSINITLPQANLPISMPIGRPFKIKNVGSRSFQMKDFLGNNVGVVDPTVTVIYIPISFATTGGAYTPWFEFTQPLPIVNGGTDNNSVLGTQLDFAIGTTHCGSKIGADFNSTADQNVTITAPAGATIYRIVRMNVTNATVSLTTAVGGVYTGAGKTGGVPIPAATTYSAITNRTANTAGNGQATAGASNLVLTATALFFALTTPQGAPATADLDFYCEPVR